MFRSRISGAALALAILSIVPGAASANTIEVTGASFTTDTICLPDAITTFHLGPTENDLHGYTVDTTIDFFGSWGTITFDAQNFSNEALTFSLNLTLPLDALPYDAASSSITGNGTSSISSFFVSVVSPAANVLSLDAGPPTTDLGIGAGGGCTVPVSWDGSSFTCSTASADAVFAPHVYNTLSANLAFSMGGSSTGASQANHLLWDAYFEVDAVPEPVSLSLTGAGLLAFALWRRRA